MIKEGTGRAIAASRTATGRTRTRYVPAVESGDRLAPLASGQQIKHIGTASEVARDKVGQVIAA